ncbi:MAG: inositol monophosphatase family protein [Flavobacteriales bacterium]|jgi:myo-inositol-1(or 4)-monophosphatase
MNLTDHDLERIAREVDELSREVGNWMKQQTIGEGQTELKTFNNLVTYVDKESERRFVEGLRAILPAAGFVAEEGTGEPNQGGLNWIIDPLDGTTNFVHGMNIWCTSVALAEAHVPLVGVIYDPSANELFSGSRSKGAFLNGKSIGVSGVSSLDKSLLATGFPYDDFAREHLYFDLLKALTHKTRGIRRLGSAALDMAWTACGRLEGFYEYGLNPWDVAAGTLLIREAGGFATDFNGGDDPIFGEDLICSNALIYEELLNEITSIFG